MPHLPQDDASSHEALLDFKEAHSFDDSTPDLVMTKISDGFFDVGEEEAVDDDDEKKMDDDSTIMTDESSAVVQKTKRGVVSDNKKNHSRARKRERRTPMTSTVHRPGVALFNGFQANVVLVPRGLGLDPLVVGDYGPDARVAWLGFGAIVVMVGGWIVGRFRGRKQKGSESAEEGG
ncbi:hypothetical protein BST61_g8374 [Cercospora zeina]